MGAKPRKRPSRVMPGGIVVNGAQAGLHRHRLSREPMEKAFSEAWERENAPDKRRKLLDDLLGDGSNRYQEFATPRDWEVASTVIQWLGSVVGQAFVRDVMENKDAQ